MNNKRYIVTGSSVEELTLFGDGFYRDSMGTIYAIAESSASVDKKNRCGIGVFSLPDKAIANDACRAHDFAYSSPVYQAYHTRKEADEKLKQDLLAMDYPILGPLFYRISRFLGATFWENQKTNI